MQRYVMPALFFAATAWVSWYNTSHDTSKIFIPMVDVLFSGAKDDPDKLGDHSVQVLFAVSVGVLLITLVEHAWALRNQPKT
jgi:hypothetical protein